MFYVVIGLLQNLLTSGNFKGDTIILMLKSTTTRSILFNVDALLLKNLNVCIGQLSQRSLKKFRFVHYQNRNIQSIRATSWKV